jgi:hypothetical protein
MEYVYVTPVFFISPLLSVLNKNIGVSKYGIFLFPLCI